MGSRKESKKAQAPAAKRELTNGETQQTTEPHVPPRKRTKIDSTEDTKDVSENRTIENDDTNDVDEEEDHDMLPLVQVDDEVDQDQDEDEDDVDMEMNTQSTSQAKAHTSDRVRKVDTNPEVEAAFREHYMAQITQAFGDELNTLRETDELDGNHLELLIDSLHQTGHVFLPSEKELVALP